jgi:hypothetical protein
MTTARAHLVDTQNGGYYHCISRCVRRGWLCGFDSLTGRSYGHRRGWLETRLLELGDIFAIDVYGYAVMSNHYHLVLEVVPKRVREWDDEEVVERWLRLGKCNDEAARAVILANAKRVAGLRKRLGSLSWFMRYINEPIARWANREDGCKGRFWEGRFKSFALLDEAAIVSCMVYVDLNPIRAESAQCVESAPHTSIRRRLRHADAPRRRLGELERFGLTVSEYLELLRCTADLERGHAPQPTRATAQTLAHFQHSSETWLQGVKAHRSKFRAYGAIELLRRYAQTLGQQWIRTSSGLALAT